MASGLFSPRERAVTGGQTAGPPGRMPYAKITGDVSNFPNWAIL